MRWFTLFWFGFLLFGAAGARATVIHVSPADGPTAYALIEGAGPGDEVVIAPGSYGFRVYLQQAGTASQPISIHAEDPANPPVWDLSAIDVASAPGSYGAGDKDRGCWQVVGDYYRLSGLVFTGCHNAGHNSAGIRYYGGATGLEITDCVFRLNDNGLTGGTQNSQATVEFCEFDRNGNLAASAPTHNLYIYGGTFALRYSYLHDPVQAQNLHCRAQDATIEYNWIARAASYAGDLMTSDDYASAPYAQSMLLRGNVIVQGATQANHGQIWAVFNDAQASGLSLSVRAVDNTLVGAGGHAALVHLSNGDGTTMSADVSNNIIAGTSVPVLVEDAANATVTGTNNWMPTGTDPGDLAASIFSADPGFNVPATNDFTLATGSACIGAASPSVFGLPDREYYRDEALTREYRNRLTAADLGAFEHTTTGPGIGPYGSVTNPDGGPPDAGPSADAGPDAGTLDAGTDGGPIDAGAVDAGTSDAGTIDAGGRDAGVAAPDGGGTIVFIGCNCSPSGSPSASALLLLTLGAALLRRRHGTAK